MYVRELRVQYRQRRLRAGAALPIGALQTPIECAALLLPLLQHEATEVMVALYLTTRHELICVHELSRGGLDATVVHPRDVFRGACLSNAAAVVLGHNHPSGDPSPSRDDLALTRRLITAGELIGIDVLDHIVVAPFDRYTSLKELGRL